MKETNRAMEWKFQTQEVKTLIILAVKFVFSQIPWNLEYCVWNSFAMTTAEVIVRINMPEV